MTTKHFGFEVNAAHRAAATVKFGKGQARQAVISPYAYGSAPASLKKSDKNFVVFNGKPVKSVVCVGRDVGPQNGAKKGVRINLHFYTAANVNEWIPISREEAQAIKDGALVAVSAQVKAVEVKAEVAKPVAKAKAAQPVAKRAKAKTKAKQ